MQNEKLPKLCKFDQRLYGYLCWVRKLYSTSTYYLAKGSFFKTDKEIAEFLGVCEDTVKRGKRRLRNAGLIKFEIHYGRSRATDYWILSEEIVKAKDQKEPPFERFRGTK